MHKFCTAGCRSTVGKSDAHSRDGSKQVLVPSTAIFHLILQICFWGTPGCLCQSPWRTRGWRAMGHFYHLTCPLSLTKTHRVDFAKSATEFVIFFPVNSHGAAHSPRLTQAEMLTGLARCARHLSAKSNALPQLLHCSREPSLNTAAASGCPAFIWTGSFDQTLYS